MGGPDARDRPNRGQGLVAALRTLVPEPDRGADKQPLFFVRKDAGTSVRHRYRIRSAEDAWIVLEHVRTEQRWAAGFYHKRGGEYPPTLVDAVRAWIGARIGPALHDRRGALAVGAMTALLLAALLASPSTDGGRE